MDKIEQGGFLDITFRFQHIRDARPDIGEWVLTTHVDYDDFFVVTIVVNNKSTGDEAHEWYDGEKYWPLGDTLWAALPEVAPVILPANRDSQELAVVE